MSTRTSAGPVPVTPQPAGQTANPQEFRQDGPSDIDEKLKGKDVRVRLHYLKADPLYDTTTPKQIVPEWQDLKQESNVKLEAGPEERLHDVRGHEKDFTLDEHGFQYVHAPTSFKDWSSQPEIGRVHLHELEGLLRKEVDGADEILFYDARLRQETETGVKVSGLSYKPFARQVHTDNTESSVISKIYNLTDMKADYYLQGRVRIINIWRPIKHPVYDCGLAVADGSKLREGDVIECNRHRADTGRFWDTMGVVKHREGFEWHYMSLQDEPDVLLFKNYDSATDVPARWCLHTAFDLPAEDIPPNAPTRESIEVRALVFTLPKHIRRPSTLGTIQHPLAADLEQARLPLVDDDHCITDHLRTDIDEGGEMKDAMLLLRKQELKRQQRLNGELEAENKRLVAKLEAVNTQLSLQVAQLVSLEMQLENLQRAQAHPLDASDTFSEVSTATSASSHTTTFDAPSSFADREAALLAHIAGQEREIARWKAEAMGRGNEVVSQVWQRSVEEGIRREREKDRWVFAEKEGAIERLRGEVERLRVRGRG